mgnify:FL=1
MEKIQKRAAISFLALMLAVTLLAFMGSVGVVQGAGKRTVRVGFFPMEGYNETKADGSRTGMDVEYLTRIP